MDRVRRAADAFRLVCEPMLADHVAMEALGRFASLVETPKMSEMQQETMACTSLVAATSGTKKEGCDHCQREQRGDVGWDRRWWHTTQKTLQ